MWQNLSVNNFGWFQDTQFNENFMKNYNQESGEGYFIEVDVQHPEKLHEIYNDLPDRMKIEKVEKLVTSLHNKTEHIIHIQILYKCWCISFVMIV